MAEQNRRTVDGDGEVPHVTVQVLPEHVEDFRAAIVDEIRWEAECIIQHGESTKDRIRFADVRSDAGLMAHDVALFDQLEEVWKGANGGNAELRVEGYEAIASVAHVFEAMARKVVGPRLQEALAVGPLDYHKVPKIRELVERLDWAVSRAASFHDKAAQIRDAMPLPEGWHNIEEGE
jgi:hypothetical protein